MRAGTGYVSAMTGQNPAANCRGLETSVHSHGGSPSARQPSSCRHRSEEPPQARAPHAGWMTVQAGLLTCGSMLCFRLPGPESPVARGKELTAYSCGRSCGLAALSRKPHRIPISPTLRPANLNAAIIAESSRMSMRKGAYPFKSFQGVFGRFKRGVMRRHACGAGCDGRELDHAAGESCVDDKNVRS